MHGKLVGAGLALIGIAIGNVWCRIKREGEARRLAWSDNYHKEAARTVVLTARHVAHIRVIRGLGGIVGLGKLAWRVDVLRRAERIRRMRVVPAIVCHHIKDYSDEDVEEYDQVFGDPGGPEGQEMPQVRVRRGNRKGIARKVALELKGKHPGFTRSAANRLVILDSARKLLEQRKVTLGDIGRILPEVEMLYWTPTLGELRAAEYLSSDALAFARKQAEVIWPK